MKYKERDELVASLREFADFIEDRGLDMPIVPEVYVSGTLPYYERKTFNQLDNKQKKAILKRLIRAIKPVKKKYADQTLYISREFGKKITMKISVSRDVACRAVPTGNKIIHAATYIPERVIEEVEWVCTDPLLKESA